jgi:ornithine cyclodeaminase
MMISGRSTMRLSLASAFPPATAWRDRDSVGATLSGDEVATNVLTDDDVRERLPAAVAVDVARRLLVDAYRGELVAPPRLHADLGGTDLVFTAGGHAGGPVGFRVYGTWQGDSDQAVLVWDAAGRLLVCVVGHELGARRTGALGGAAVDALARADADEIAVVGSGRQAWTQLWAASAVRRPAAVRVFSPDPGHRERFARRASDELGLPAGAVSGPREALHGAGVVLLATTSAAPVIEPEWIEPGTHVNTVGPKLRSAHETPVELVEAAAVVSSDSPTQAAAYGEAFFTERDLTNLGAILASDAVGRASDEDVTVYCSTGLAGSEVAMALALTGDDHAPDRAAGSDR